MFYRSDTGDHGLPHNPFKAIVAPRPIGWISTLDADGNANLAPYSFFNAVADTPPMIMYSSTGEKVGIGGVKDTIANLRETGEFTVSIVSYALRDAMNKSSGAYEAGVDEYALAGLTKGESRTVAPPFVAEAPAALECKVWKIIDLPGETNVMTIGQVTGIHIRDEVLVNGMIDLTLYKPLSRLGYRDYAAVETLFPLNRPGQT
ncbi:flavin reductase family protein [Oceanomicrobium pacificus]|uniref:Flavin reductase family protein n=1 Tax=Oceanomicrobium pacificus TaxID=2692916 RepID=A0A6B0U036_9RHOB|nr:flavin reductase family protein [Oceanomicrobium pacificus]MXU66862.1 flavin reductase family protein [Oceanomicrobium pacificus]